MIIHLDSDQPKQIEQKVQKLILKKLFIKVDDEKIFIDKHDFINLILLDVIALAKSDGDIDKSLELALQFQPHYQESPDIKRVELEEALSEFEVEVDAYKLYLNDLEEGITEDEIYLDVLSMLNSERELLEKRLHELMMEALSLKLSEEDARMMGFDRWSLLDNFSHYVRFIASNETIDDAVEEMQLEMEMSPNKYMVKKGAVKRELERIAPLAADEIGAYKMALAMEAQNAEFPMILAVVKQLLNLED
ncbi:MAG: hypothetical protein EOO07_21575 [Chitinophagaceae bacterium]|nr:MAG: hypothetical protein EOO07_21575 [Chitinophagaceae bacterium]